MSVQSELTLDAGPRWGRITITDPCGVGLEGVTANSGHYATVIRVEQQFTRIVPGLGRCTFEPGTYVNVGTMKRGLIKRVARHMTKRKKLGVWHVDRLTTAPAARVLGVVLVRWASWTEHTLSDAVGARLGLTTPIAGFSAADCGAGCAAHLWYSPRPVTLLQVARAVAGVCAVRASTRPGDVGPVG